MLPWCLEGGRAGRVRAGLQALGAAHCVFCRAFLWPAWLLICFAAAAFNLSHLVDHLMMCMMRPSLSPHGGLLGSWSQRSQKGPNPRCSSPFLQLQPPSRPEMLRGLALVVGLLLVSAPRTARWSLQLPIAIALPVDAMLSGAAAASHYVPCSLQFASKAMVPSCATALYNHHVAEICAFWLLRHHQSEPGLSRPCLA